MSVEDTEDRINVKAFKVVDTPTQVEIHQLLDTDEYRIRIYEKTLLGNKMQTDETHPTKPEGVDVELKENILYKT